MWQRFWTSLWGEGTVRTCIANAAVSALPHLPIWGDRLPDGHPLTSTSTVSGDTWLNIGPEDVGPWSEADFVAFLETAGREFHVEDDAHAHAHAHGHGARVRLLDLVMRGKPDETVAEILRGNRLGRMAAAEPPLARETEVERRLELSVWAALSSIMGEMPHRYPASHYVSVRVPTDGGVGVVRMPPHLRNWYRLDRAVEATLCGFPPRADAAGLFAHHAEMVNMTSAVARLVRLCGRFIIEIKLDAVCPQRRYVRWRNHTAEELHDRNAAVGGGLLDYVLSEHFDPHFNPVAQVTTYACATRTRHVAVCTLNHMTYGCVEMREGADGTTQPFVHLTPKFDWSSAAPPLPSRPDWSHWEVLIRFVLATIGEWYAADIPDALKLKFVRRPKRKFRDADDEDDEDDSGGDDGDDDAPMDDVGSAPKGGSRAARGRGGSAKRGRTAAAAATSSSGGAHRTRRSQAPGARSRPGRAQGELARSWGTRDEPLIEPVCWADLWAPLRFAVPRTHPVEVECSEDHLEGDADLIAEGRVGPVYRQRLQGRDAVVKILAWSCPRESDLSDGVDPVKYRAEMEREADAYGRLRELQGASIPRLLWFGEIVANAADALVTEYAGAPLPPIITSAQFDAAVQALEDVHRHGVLHGDVALRNFVCNGDGGGEDAKCVRVVDFGLAVFREEVDDGDGAWARRAAEEMEQARRALQTLLTRAGDKGMDLAGRRRGNNKRRSASALEADAEGGGESEVERGSPSRRRRTN